MNSTLFALSKRLGYTFKDSSLLAHALTHRSASTNNNERLEFLGDGLVNVIIAEALYHQFSQLREGDLSRLRSRLVKGETLSILAKEFKVTQCLNLGTGERRTGGAERPSILADAMEAIIGAIYLDSNFETCKACVLNWYQSRLLDKQLLNNLKDPKTRLQEYLQARQLPLPQYAIDHTAGEEHQRTFYVSCQVEGMSLQSQGSGNNRRQAEQQAAQNFLDSINATQ